MEIKSINHPEAAEKFTSDKDRTTWHDETLWFVREKRDLATKSLPEWEELREMAAAIKSNVLSNLDTYLVQFEENAKKNNIQVHWASTAKDHNDIVYSILKKNSVTKLVKSKSMLTEDCHLNQYLEERGVEVIDTDLGERIVPVSYTHLTLPTNREV